MAMFPFPPGFRFVPTNNEILTDYLFKKIKGLPLSYDYAIIECDIYDGKDKWKEFFESNPLDKSLYFFTKLKKKTEKGVRIGRCTGSGTWRETQKEKNIYSDDDDEMIIGTKKSFKFVGASKSSNFRWLMDEYHLDSCYIDDQSINEYVVCHIKCEKERNSSKSSCNIQAVDQSPVSVLSAAATPLLINSSTDESTNVDDLQISPMATASITTPLIDSSADWTNINLLEAYMHATDGPTSTQGLENWTSTSSSTHDSNSNYATPIDTFSPSFGTVYMEEALPENNNENNDDFGTEMSGMDSNLWTTSEELESLLMLPLETNEACC